MQNQIRVSKSLGGGFDGDPKELWGCKDYSSIFKATVFCGMYDIRDYLYLALHRGKAWVFWCGGDILNLERGYLFNDGKWKWLNKFLGNKWVLKVLNKAEHWCENAREQQKLLQLGIKAEVCPSFFGKITDYEVEFEPFHIPQTLQVYLSASEGRQVEYGWGIIDDLAIGMPGVTFHLYGASWKTEQSNIKVHGKVSQEQMNKEIKKMHCGLRMNDFDGFSEITAKSVLWGQYPITAIPHPNIQSFSHPQELKHQLLDIMKEQEANIHGRYYYLNAINKFPWCEIF